MENLFQENEVKGLMHYVSQHIVIKQEEYQVEDKHLDSRRPTVKPGADLFVLNRVHRTPVRRFFFLVN
jgi:hypothetical protein